MARVVATEASSQTGAKVHIVQARCLLAGQRREQVRARAFAAARLERCPLAVVGVEQPRDVRVKSLMYGGRDRLLYFRPGVREASFPVELVVDPECADRRLRRGNEAGQLGEARTDCFGGAQTNCLRDVMQAELPGPQERRGVAVLCGLHARAREFERQEELQPLVGPKVALEFELPETKCPLVPVLAPCSGA